MIVYLYDPTTKEFTGTGIAHPDQMSKGDFIHPANSTGVEPPECTEGKVLVWGDGEWVESDPTPLTVEEIEKLRAIAYSDSITGSDRHFIEAARKRATGDEDGAIEAEQLGVARVSEIKEAIK